MAFREKLTSQELRDIQAITADLTKIDWTKPDASDVSETALTNTRRTLQALSTHNLNEHRREFHYQLTLLERIRFNVAFSYFADPHLRIAALIQLDGWLNMIAKEAVFKVQPVDQLILPFGTIIENTHASGDKSTMRL